MSSVNPWKSARSAVGMHLFASPGRWNFLRVFGKRGTKRESAAIGAQHSTDRPHDSHAILTTSSLARIEPHGYSACDPPMGVDPEKWPEPGEKRNGPHACGPFSETSGGQATARRPLAE